MADSAVRYVALDGNDNYDGLDWSSPKRHIHAAVNVLPTAFSSGVEYHFGRVEIGSGQFREEGGPLEYNSSIVYAGRGNGPGGRGTEVLLDNGENSHVFATTDDWIAAGNHCHGVGIQDLTIDGNVANQSDPQACVRLYNGGFNSFLRNVSLTNARYGLLQERNAINQELWGCTWANCFNGAIYWDHTEGTGSCLSVYGGQVDDCGLSAVVIDHDAQGSISGNGYTLNVFGLKVEGDHDKVIHFIPGVKDFGNPFTININGLTANRWPVGGTAIIYEEARGAKSFPGEFNISGVTRTGYTKLFKSDKTGVESVGEKSRFATFGGYNVNRTVAMEIDGVVVEVAEASPENKVVGTPGSFCLVKDGRAFLKRTGTCTAGWKEILTV